MFVFSREIWSWFWAGLKIDRAILSYLVSYYYTVRSDDVKVLKSRWNFVKTKTTTPGNNIYTLLITFIAFTRNSYEFLLLLHLFHLGFKLYFSHTNSHITLGPPVVTSAANDVYWYGHMWHLLFVSKILLTFQQNQFAWL